MAVRKGVDVLIFVNTGTEATPVWTPVGGQRNATLTEEAEPIEVTTKDSPAREFVPGKPSWSLSCDGLVVVDDTALAALTDAIREQKTVKVRVKEGDTYTAEGNGIVQSRETEFPYEEGATYRVEIQGSGPLTPNPTP